MDALRFLAAFAVLAGHSRSLLLEDYRPDISLVLKILYFATGFGHQAVIVFFVLSGFWISKTVVLRYENVDFWQKYISARLTRLWIVLIPALALGAALDAFGAYILEAPLYLGEIKTLTIKTPIDLSSATLSGNLFFLQSLAVPTYGTNGPLWSLAYEFWFYMWFPALYFLWRGRPIILLCCLSLGIFYSELLTGFFCWLAGSALFLMSENCKNWVAPRYAALSITVAGLIATVTSLTLSRLGYSSAFSDFTLSISVALILFGSMSGRFSFGRWVKPFAAYGAKSSFSLYAIHFPILTLAVSLIAPRRLAPTSYSVLILSLVIVLLLLCGWAFSRATEAHTDRVRSTLREWSLAMRPPKKIGL
jgi:peptidoglycan/LPS O-acetylase OafA/YrhL